MNVDKDKLFEDHLRQVEPVPVDDLLAERIARQIRQSNSANHANRWPAYVGWGGLVAAACIMIVAGLTFFTGSPVPAGDSPVEDAGPVAMDVSDYDLDEDAFKPVLAQNNLTERIDEGIVFLDGGLTARKYRYQFIDRIVWRNPKNGARVEMQVPRDEVVLIPVQTY